MTSVVPGGIAGTQGGRGGTGRGVAHAGALLPVGSLREGRGCMQSQDSPSQASRSLYHLLLSTPRVESLMGETAVLAAGIVDLPCPAGSPSTTATSR